MIQQSADNRQEQSATNKNFCHVFFAHNMLKMQQRNNKVCLICYSLPKPNSYSKTKPPYGFLKL